MQPSPFQKFRVPFFLFSIAVLAFSVLQLPENALGQADVLRYSRNKVGLEQAILRYHNDMNTLFDDHVKKLFSVTQAGSKYIVAPPEDKSCSDQKNISTFCLAIRAVDIHDAFIQGLDTHRGFLKNKQDSSNPTINEMVGQLDRRLELINEQIQISEKVMSTAIGTYDQIQTFYPLHVQYTSLIESLEGYRDGLADVRKEVEKFPGTFHNVTTTECT